MVITISSVSYLFTWNLSLATIGFMPLTREPYHSNPAHASVDWLEINEDV
jgi:hypothetical protein